MSMSHFGNIRVALAEPNSALRAELHESLTGVGFKDVTVTGNLSRVANAVNHDEVDLLIADTSLPEGDFNEYVKELRHGHQGANPFLVVITLVNAASSKAVHTAINSGTDHVLAKPFTAEALIEKITDLTHARKRFVVTTDYIGPDRRVAHRAGTMEVPLIDVPNPLHHRMSEHVSNNQIKHSIEMAKIKVNEQKVQSHAHQIGWLLESVMPELVAIETDMPFEASENLQRLSSVSHDMCERIKGTRYAHITEMCLTLGRMADEALKGELVGDDMQLLGRMADIIGHAFNPDRETLAMEYQRKARAQGINVFKASDSHDLTRKELTPKEVAAVAVA